MKTPILLVLLCYISFIPQSFAWQTDESGFTLLSKKDGLSHDYVTALAQDSTGFLWISTQSGLNRFNGSSFVQYHSTEDSGSLPAEKLNGMVWLDKWRLLTYNIGMHIIDTRTGETRNLFIPYKDRRFQYKFNWIMAALAGDNGDIYVLARSGFYHFDKNYRLLFRFDYYTDKQVPVENFGFGGQLFRLGKNLLGISGIDGLYLYSPKQNLFKKSSFAECPAIAGFNSMCMFLQPFPDNLLVINPEGDSLVCIHTPCMARFSIKLPFNAAEQFDYHTQSGKLNDSTAYLTGKSCGYFLLKRRANGMQLQFEPQKKATLFHCRAVLQDKDRHLWVATSKGLLRQEEAHPYIEQTQIPAAVQEAFPNMRIDHICDAGKWLVIASRPGGGLLVLDKQTLRVNRRISLNKYGKPGESISCLLPVNDSTLLAGDYGPLLKINTKNWSVKTLDLPGWDTVNDWVADMINDGQGGVWIAAGRLYHYDLSTGNFSMLPIENNLAAKIEQPQRLGFDRLGNLWLAGHGMVRYNKTNNSFDQYIDSFPFIKMTDRQVNSFLFDQYNRLWLNSNNNGLACYDSRSHKWSVYTRENGLPDNNIADMVIKGNKLWLATFSGIACMDLSSNKITSFDAEDGFPDLPIYIGARFFSDRLNSNMAIGFNNTFARFDAALGYQKTEMPGLFIESITTLKDQLNRYKGSSPLKKFTANWNNSNLVVTIGTINFFTNKAQRFSFRISGSKSAPWTSLGTNNSFNISNLPPGDHLVEVKLTSLNHRWPDKIISFTITITPPFWMESWFVGLVSLVLFFLVYLLFHWRATTIRKKEQTKTAIEKLKAEEYKMQYELEQINHFFSASLPDNCSVDEMLGIVANDLLRRMCRDNCVIYLWDDQSDKLVPKAICCPENNTTCAGNNVHGITAGQELVKYVRNVNEVLKAGPETEHNIYRISDHRVITEMYVPIIDSRELLGAIDAEHTGKDDFGERDIKILTTIATLTAARIKQIESMQSLQLKQREIAVVNQQLAEAQLSALQTQMNPHFIFNALNSIKGMILNNEQRQASRYLSKFANMIRMTLAQSKQLFITLEENIEYLETYLAMEKLRFDDSFTYDCKVDESIDPEEILVPALMIQPLVENGIWHGLLNKSGEKNISIHFSRTEDTICCCIEDNGIGINKSIQQKTQTKPSHQSVGLSNLRNRIAILNEKYASGCSLKITDLMDIDEAITGTRVILTFNLITNTVLL